jgi:23S rRNA (uracil1939-C5)-methyltransferase
VGSGSVSRSRRVSAAAASIEEGIVADLTHDAEGVVREGRACFVPGALPGERIRFRRIRQRKTHDEGVLEEIVTPSPDRVTPRCAHFGVCGGCALQHLSADAQVAAKQRELAEALSRIGGVEPDEWLAPLRGPEWHYRRRARLSARYVHKKERSLVGFRERAGAFVTDVQTCAVLAEPVGSMIAALGHLLTSLDIRTSIPQIEVAVSEGETALVLRVLDPPTDADRARLQEFETAHRVRLYLQPKGPDTVAPLREGPVDLHYRIERFDVRLDFLPTDFVQVNSAINESLASLAVEHLQLDADARVLDLFCGLGNFTLPIARHAAAVVGVEGDPGLVARARQNATRNGIDNARFFAADLSVTPDSRLPWLVDGYSHVLLDPPRVGAAAVIGAVARLKPRRIVYIACHTGSLARDVGELCRTHGFGLRAAGILDMFPHTHHVESIAILEA